MFENRMAELAKFLGVELNEEFYVECSDSRMVGLSERPLKLALDGLWELGNDDVWRRNSLIEEICRGYYRIVK